MTDRSALRDRLQRLAATGFGDGAVRTIRAADTEGLLAAILFEADTLVMPRELRLEGSSGQGLALEVSNRRVLCARPPAAGAEPVSLDSNDPGATDRLRQMLLAMLGSGTTARIQHVSLGREVDPAEPGISVGVLSETWGLPTSRPDREEGEAIDAFLSTAGDHLPAWLMISDQASESFGDESLVEGLVALSEGGLAQRLRDRSGRDTWRFAAIGPYVEEAPHRAVVAIGTTLFIVAIAPDSLGEVADHWRRAVA